MTEEIRRKGNEVYTVWVCVCADLESIYEIYRGQTIEISVPQDISVSTPHYTILLYCHVKIGTVVQRARERAPGRRCHWRADPGDAGSISREQ